MSINYGKSLLVAGEGEATASPSETRDNFSLRMLSYRLADSLALLTIKSLVGLVAVLPESTGRWIARGVVEIFLILMPRLRRVGLKNLAAVFPEKTTAERKQILAASLWHFSDNLLAFAKIPYLTPDAARKMVDWQQTNALVARIRAENPNVGILLPTLHFGNFEMILQLQALNDRPIGFLARGFGLERTDNWWNQRRGRFGCRMFSRKGGFAEMVRRISEGEDIGILFDQNVKPNHAMFVDLFGIPAATTKALGLAAIRTRCPIVFAALANIGPQKYEIITQEIRNPVDDATSVDERIATLMRDLHACLESTVRRFPEQWFWIHRRFKTRPRGQAENFYSEN